MATFTLLCALIATVAITATAAGRATDRRHATAAATHREHEINDARMTANGPLSNGSTWTGTLSTRNDNDWYRLYLSRPTQVTITVTNTSRHGTHPMGIQLLGRANEIHYSTIFYPGNHRTLARTFKRGEAWVHITASPGYEVTVPTTYTVVIHASSKLLTHRP